MWSLLLLGRALAAPPPLMAGEDAFLFTLPVVNGSSKDATRTQVSLGDFTGPDPMSPRKAVIVYFFTRASAGTDLSALDRLQKKHASHGLQVIGISLDGDPTGDTSAWLGGLKLGFPVLSDQYQIVKSRYGVDTTPVTYVVDADGNVHSVGNPHGPDYELELETQVGVLLVPGVP
jgi:peroxiredoxin